MTAARSTAHEYRYRKHMNETRPEDCPFCEVSPHDERFIAETDSLRVIRNIFPYSFWDGQGVVDHLLITPKQHTDSLADLPLEAAGEFVQLLNTYESAGYNMYARTPSSNIKSVVHQHTHLIKLDGRPRRLLFYMHRPFYVRLSR